MRNLLRTLIAVTVGLATMLLGQLVIENTTWWWTGGTATFDAPLLNAVKFGIAGSVGLTIGAIIVTVPKRRRRLH